MNLKKSIGLFLIVSFAFACDNEVDLNADYEDTTVVYSLIDAGSDTQFVRVSKTFLQDGVNAIQLATDPNRLYYDSLNVRLINTNSNSISNLSSINRKKSSGVFTSQNHRVYFTTDAITKGNTYRLEVIQPNGKITKASTRALGDVNLIKPSSVNQRQVSFVNNVQVLQNYDFEFSIPRTIAKFESKLFFLYDEIINGIPVSKEVEISIGAFTNSNLESLNNVEIQFPGKRFYETIASQVSPNANRKVFQLDSCLRIDIIAGDEQLIFYQELNGPLDGVAQVRPEYTNFENGIGLFASRSSVSYFAKLNDFSRTELRTGTFTGNHNFVDP